jgi:hypothetical protein
MVLWTSNSLAKAIVDQAIGDKPIKKKQPATDKRGYARAAALTPEKRVEIAKKAASERLAKSSHLE